MENPDFHGESFHCSEQWLEIPIAKGENQLNLLRGVFVKLTIFFEFFSDIPDFQTETVQFRKSS